MFEFGEHLYRVRMRRENPGVDEAAIERMVLGWRTTAVVSRDTRAPWTRQPV
jgi:hypothetical protein